MRIKLNELKKIIREELTAGARIAPDWKVIAHHVTVLFGKDAKVWATNNPQEIGKEYTINVAGLACDEQACAVEVEIPLELPQDLQDALSQKIPHITVAVAPGVKPVYSNELLQRLGGGTESISVPPLTGVLQFEAGYLGLILDGGSHSALVSAVQGASSSVKTESLRRIIRACL